MITFMLQRRAELERGCPPATAIRTNGVGWDSDYHINWNTPLGLLRPNAVLIACSNMGHYWLHSSGARETYQRIFAWRGTSAEFRKLRDAVPFARSFHLEADQ